MPRWARWTKESLPTEFVSTIITALGMWPTTVGAIQFKAAPSQREADCHGFDVMAEDASLTHCI